jgi:hypothetical protein
MFELIIDGIHVADFVNKDSAELGKLIAYGFKSARSIKLKEVV